MKYTSTRGQGCPRDHARSCHGHVRWKPFGPRRANLVLIAYASSEGSGEMRIRAVSPEPSLLAHTSSESRGTFRQKARSLAPLNGWACAVEICNDGMLEDTNSLDGAHLKVFLGTQMLRHHWNLVHVYNIRYSSTNKFLKTMILDWPLHRKVRFAPL